MNWKRFIGVVVGALTWMTLEIINGKPPIAADALLVGFVITWATERAR